MRPLRHLSATEVAAAMPPLAERLALAERTMRALGRGAEMPAKIGVHPRQPGSLAHAMPALLHGEATDGSGDLIGTKWITGFPANPARGLPAYQALVVLNDPLSGDPIAVMDGGAITAQRTAAISGTAIRHFAPRVVGEAPARVAVLGAGAQARSHLPVIGYLLTGARVRITDTDGARAAALAGEAADFEGIGSVEAVASVREAVEGADVVVSVVSFGPEHQLLRPEWLGTETLFVAVDYDMQAPASLAREAMFVVDDREQFLAARSGPTFAGYPDPDATLGEALRGEALRGEGSGLRSDGSGLRSEGSGLRGEGSSAAASGDHGPRTGARGRVLVSHLGVGLADVVFAAAVLERAEQLGLGRLLPR